MVTKILNVVGWIGMALVLAALAVFVGPLSYLALAFCVWLLAAQRRRSARKYEGLRVLR